MFKVKKTNKASDNNCYKIQSADLMKALNVLLNFYPKTTRVISLTGGGEMNIDELIKFAAERFYVVLDRPVIEYMNKLYKERKNV